jgi:acyl-CoA synthetase (AMP-forming)/AMP-acid ligase II
MYKLQKLSLNRKIIERSIATTTTREYEEKYFIKDKHTKLTRDEVFKLSRKLADSLRVNNKILNNEKISILCPNNYAYAISMLATWLNGGVALGLNKTYPNNILKYFLNDSTCKLAINVVNRENGISTEEQNIVDLLKSENVNHYDLVENEFYKEAKNLNYENCDLFKKFKLDSDALILYTSGKLLVS